jgi:hypothetical protein
MADFTRPATWEDVKLVASILDAAGVQYALIGGYAVAAHGYHRFSEDIDILVEPSADNTKRWIEALSHLPDGASRELFGQENIFQQEGPYAIRINDEFTIDVMPAACGHGWQELHDFIISIDVDGQGIRVLSIEGLLLTKEGMRDKDRADTRVLKAALDKLRSNDE